MPGITKINDKIFYSILKNIIKLLSKTVKFIRFIKYILRNPLKTGLFLWKTIQVKFYKISMKCFPFFEQTKRLLIETWVIIRHFGNLWLFNTLLKDKNTQKIPKTWKWPVAFNKLLVCLKTTII